MTKRKSTATRRAEAEAAAARAAVIRKEQERRERRRRTVVVVVALAVLAAIGTAVSVYLDRTGAPATAPKGAVATYAVPSGPASAPVTVSVYEDFMCPFCGDFEAASRAALQKDVDAGKVQLRYHVLNFLDDRSTSERLRQTSERSIQRWAAGGEAAARRSRRRAGSSSRSRASAAGRERKPSVTVWSRKATRDDQ